MSVTENRAESGRCFDPENLRSVTEFRGRFHAARPFRHLAIDGFFTDEFCRELAAAFPPFDVAVARNEWGRPSGKCVRSALRDLGAVYRRLDDLLRSRALLDWLEAVTGIPGLVYDDENFGGGTHENRHGQGLLPHVDFNYHPTTHLHRRLNLIVYLNEDWCAEWGGAIELHANPREPGDDVVVSYTPDFNRCVLFETNERSWHGFAPIALPIEHRTRSRKSISIYYYTRERPSEETFAEHTTHYVPPPLPEKFAPGRTLSQADAAELRALVELRDRLLELAQRPAPSERASPYRERLDMLGYVRQVGAVQGLYHDGWTAAAVEVEIVPERDVSGLVLRAFGVAAAAEPQTARVEVNGELVGEAQLGSDECEVACALRLERRVPARLRIVTSPTVNCKALGYNEDIRDLGLRIVSVTFEHDAPKAP